MTLPVDTLLQGGKYRIVRFISSGGFGCTYEAIHVNLGERVAIKEFFVKDFCNRDETTAHITVGTVSKRALVDKLRRKFVDEAKALYKLKHNGIVRVSDVFEENGTAYYVMDYVDGLSLGEIVKQQGAMSEQRALHYIRQVAEALQYVHDHNRLHLDIKPGNIMVDSSDNAVLIDFGASKQYDEEAGENTSTLMGKTPGYAPVEQMGNDVVRFLPATDIYALGATLYKLLTGITPLSANMLAGGDRLDPLPAAVSPSTRRAIAAAMQLRKVDRPQTIGEFIALLDAEEPAAATAAAPESEETVFDEPKTATAEKTQSSASSRAEHAAATKPDYAPSSKPDPKPASKSAATSQPADGVKSYKSVLPPEPEPSFLGRHKGWIAAVCVVLFAVVGFVGFVYFNSKLSKSVSQPSGSADGHDYVDLGLSVMWATCNVGAECPPDYGGYFAWGETVRKSEFTENNCKTYNKNLSDIAGNPQYDAARANWGGSWRLPNKEDWLELIDKCDWQWITLDRHNGYKVTSKVNGNSIFLPAGGAFVDTSWEDYDDIGGYWCALPYENTSGTCFFIYKDRYILDHDSRKFGWSIRPVFDSPANTDNSQARLAGQKRQQEAAEQARLEEERRKQEERRAQEEAAKPKPTTGTIAGHDWVDLGLSVKWATCNVGASSPSAYGNYYAWGETTTKSEYMADNCRTWEKNMGDISGNSQYDAARANWGGSWRMPTEEEMQELVDKCTWTWTTQGGHNGYKVTSKTNGNSIFLPAAGWRHGSSLDYESGNGRYWGSTYYESYSQSACSLYFDSDDHYVSLGGRDYGHSVRPVSE